MRLKKLFYILVLLTSFYSSVGVAETFMNPVTTKLLSHCEFNDLTCAGSTHHTGFDYSKNGDHTVVASNDGVIVRIEKMHSRDHGMGNNVIIQHTLANGKIIYSSYSHLLSINTSLLKGEPIKRGKPIGKMGGSGYGKQNHWGVHLHFELKVKAVSGAPYGGDYWGYVPNNPLNYGYLNPKNYIGKINVMPLSQLEVYDFWQSRSDLTYPASCFNGDNIIDAQFKVRNISSNSLYIKKLALALHKSDDSYLSDLKVWSSEQSLQPNGWLHLKQGSTWVAKIGQYKLVAKAFYGNEWHRLTVQNFTVVTNNNCSNTSDTPYFDGTGSLIDPERGTACSGCGEDLVKLHSHGQQTSAGFFQVFKIPNACESIDLKGLGSATVEVRSWSGRGTNSKYYNATNSSHIIPLNESSNWSLIAFKTNAPIPSGSTRTVTATCLSNDSSNVSETSGTPMKFDNNYFWGGNGSLIAHTSNQYSTDTQAGYGKDRDTVVLLKDHKTLSVFQITNGEACRKVRFTTPVPFNLSWKLWNEKDWRGSKAFRNNDIFTFPTNDYWWILKIKAPSVNENKARIDAVCEQ